MYEKDRKAFKVLQFADIKARSNLVLLDAGSRDGIVSGQTFKVFRLSQKAGSGKGLWIQTGRLKVVNIQDKVTLAEIQEQGNQESRAFFGKFSGIMAGDWAVENKHEIVSTQQVLPVVTFTYAQVFSDPKGDPASFELTETGKKSLKELAGVFGSARVPMLMVEGHTGYSGTTEAAQIESYQRALTIRQFLIDEMGFDPDRVNAIGHGKNEPVAERFSPGAEQLNRRIVLKVIEPSLEE